MLIKGTCKTHEYWHYSYKQCLSRKNEHIICSDDRECLNDMNCVNGTCACSSFQYHNTTAVKCEDQKRINQSCTINHNCRVDKGLICANEMCQCNASNPYWSVTYDECLHTYQQPCVYDQNCDANRFLFCPSNLSYQCNCPETTRVNYCDCLPGKEDN